MGCCFSKSERVLRKARNPLQPHYKAPAAFPPYRPVPGEFVVDPLGDCQKYGGLPQGYKMDVNQKRLKVTHTYAIPKGTKQVTILSTGQKVETIPIEKIDGNAITVSSRIPAS
jgi:hypothetical protein